jgi:hypothetical protein
MRQIKLDAPMDTSAMIKTKGVIVNGNRFSSLEWACFRLQDRSQQQKVPG